jgi:hypothetical protein
MPHAADGVTPADRHDVTLSLSLALDRTGQLLQGELVDTMDTLQKRSTSAAGLYQAMEAWLRQPANGRELFGRSRR